MTEHIETKMDTYTVCTLALGQTGIAGIEILPKRVLKRE